MKAVDVLPSTDEENILCIFCLRQVTFRYNLIALCLNCSKLELKSSFLIIKGKFLVLLLPVDRGAFSTSLALNSVRHLYPVIGRDSC